MIQKSYAFFLVLLCLFWLAFGCSTKSQILNKEAMELAQKGQWEQAIAKFTLAIETDPENLAPYLNLTQVYLIVKKGDQALEMAKKAVSLYPESVEARVLLAQSYLLIGEKEKADQIFQKLTQEYPKNPFLYISMGNIARSKEDWDIALAHYEKAIEVDPRSDQAYLQMGRVCLEREIKKWKSKTTSFVPDIEDPKKMITHMANLIASGGLDLDQAMAYFRKAIYLNPLNIEARIMLGILFFQRTDYQQAELEWNEALNLSPHHPFLHMALGIHAQQKKDYERARKFFEKASELSPDQPHPILLQVLLLVSQKEYSQAIQKVKETSAFFPDFEEFFFSALLQEPYNHVPWLASCLYYKDKEVVKFATRALAFLTHTSVTDPEYWKKWWEQEKSKIQKQAQRIWPE